MEISKLIAESEHQHLDYKGPMSFDGDDRIELAKDIIAMANTRDGGTIVIGISEDRPTGKWKMDGVTADQARTFDVTKIHDFVKERAVPPIKLTSVTMEHEGRLFVVIQIPEFDDQPHLCTKEGQTSTGKSVFRRGDILYRTTGAKSERIGDESSMRQLLGMAIQRRADSILRDISRLMRGAPVGQSPGESPWAISRRLAEGYSPRKGAYEKLGSWTFILHPDEPFPSGEKPHEALRKISADARVSLRGWDFPHSPNPTNRKDPSSSLLYIQESTDWQDHVEATTLCENGFFMLERIMDEDLEARAVFEILHPSNPGSYLDWLGALYIVGEFAVFTTRLYEAFKYEGRINYQVQLHSTAGRVLQTLTQGRNLWQKIPCAEPEIRIAGGIDAAVLRSEPAEFAVAMLKQIYSLYHWQDPSESMLQQDLQKLFSRRF